MCRFLLGWLGVFVFFVLFGCVWFCVLLVWVGSGVLHVQQASF